MKITALDLGAFALITMSITSAANALVFSAAPAPALGLGAAALIGVGYRALKRRIGR